MALIAEARSLFEIDMELDGLLEEIQEQVETQGEASEDLVARFQQFCEAHTHSEKIDRIGRFVRMMEAREQFCRSEAGRLNDRARSAAGKIERTKNMVLFYLLSRDLKKIEGREFTLRVQRNSQDTLRITDETAVPKSFFTGLMPGSESTLGDNSFSSAGYTHGNVFGGFGSGDPARR